MSECEVDSSGHGITQTKTDEQAEPEIGEETRLENKLETTPVVDTGNISETIPVVDTDNISETRPVVDTENVSETRPVVDKENISETITVVETENISEITIIADKENTSEQSKMETEPYDIIANKSQEMLNKTEAICDEAQSEDSPTKQKTIDDNKEQKPLIDRKNRFKGNSSTENSAIASMDDNNLSEKDANDLSVNNEVDDKEQKFTVDRRNRFKGNVRDINNDFEPMYGYNYLSETEIELKQKALEQYEFFWRSHSPFSQWYLSEFTVDGNSFNSAEQYMMYSKAMLFEDEDIAYDVLRESDPCEQKKFGRLVRNFNQELWKANCSAIVERGNKAKFSQDENLKRILLDTYPKTLVEASPYDSIWGIGLEENDPMAWDCETWRGQNLLGKALTKVRDELKQEEKKGENQSEEYQNTTTKRGNNPEKDITDTVDESILNQNPNFEEENTNLLNDEKTVEFTKNSETLPVDIHASIENNAKMEDTSVENPGDNSETNKTSTEDSQTPETIISEADNSETNKTSTENSQTPETII
ncbi:unnamed protein product [Mytilus coruscus]|uniref:NADAR domain-containing protein n=1 Tax=Mytilus coruscus TaxID=42192 RepID=A0A6J8EI01_MYTCO|nr:unnamed protein product [Mytilus coruscus]